MTPTEKSFAAVKPVSLKPGCDVAKEISFKGHDYIGFGMTRRTRAYAAPMPYVPSRFWSVTLLTKEEYDGLDPEEKKVCGRITTDHLHLLITRFGKP